MSCNSSKTPASACGARSNGLAPNCACARARRSRAASSRAAPTASVEFWPEDMRPEIARVVTAAAGGRAGRLVAHCPTMKGTPKWWDVSVVPVLGPDGGARVPHHPPRPDPALDP
ncbi:PAS domain-containing protein [Methylobacterium sp. 092160098-2]|uniref:PAS domain-containing protein n=1 Tax=Methylobacterium sp. 092160098-2 TaxID=3025129 RepID=UPI00406D102F